MLATGPLVAVGPADPRVGRPVPAYERALVDPSFRARVGGRYAGGHDLLDALWWLEHPRAAGPSGAVPPAVLVAIARRPLYAASPSVGAIIRYLSVARFEEADRASLIAALGAAEPPLERALGAAEPPPPRVPAAAPARAEIAPEAAHRWRFHGAYSAIVVLAAVAALGWMRPAPPPASAVSGASRPAQVVLEVRTAPADALTVFERAAAFGGVPVRESRLATVAGTAVVAVRTRGLICLELRARAGASGVCGSLAAFRRTGLQFALPNGSGNVGDVQWFPDGRLRLSVTG